MTTEILRGRLSGLVRRLRWLRLARRLALCWGIAALLVGGVLLVQRNTGYSWAGTMPLLAVLILAATVVMLVRSRRDQPGIHEAAERIERAHPELKGLVLTASQQQAPPGGELGWLQQRVVGAALEHDWKHRWSRLVPASRLLGMQVVSLAALVLCLGLLWSLRVANHRAAVAAAKTAAGSGVEISPGDTSLERGFNLVILVRFGGAPPTGVELVYQAANGTEQRLPLVKSLADPLFGGSIASVDEDLRYHVEYAGTRSRDFQVTVFEHPRLDRADADLTYPAYTGLPSKRIEDTHRVSAVEGTRLDLALQLNKPVVSAKLVPRGGAGESLALSVETNRAAASLGQFTLATNAAYELRLVDDAGRTNKVPATFVFDVFPNRSPEMKLASPRGDARPSALEEVVFEGTIWDDFGVPAYGLAFTQVGQETKFVELGQGVTGREKRPFQHVLRLEDLGVKPGEVVAWFVWADDLGPNGEVRRNTGDLFFGEVRPFEQVFREGQGGGGGEGEGEAGQQGGGNPTAKLAELQKQIINATWKLKRVHGDRPGAKAPAAKPVKESDPAVKGAAIRRSPEPAPSLDPAVTAALADRRSFSRSQFLGQRANPDESAGPPRRPPGGGRNQPAAAPGARVNPPRNSPASYESDLAVVREAAEQAIEQAHEAMDRQENAAQKALWTSAISEMERSLKVLDAAAKSPAALAEALVAEQAAYQALLKLQAGERQVTRGQNRSQSQGQGEESNQRQLEQLDLTQEQDRYETQRQARAPQDQAQREQLQVLNRLQELARRQQDLNERLKELQSSLPEARTEAEREELKRQLKRLQDEQRQMLSDVDELRQRMDRPENQSRFAEERQRLEQTREDVQRAAEAAGQGSVPQAIASGTRAQRQLQEMRDELRKQSSSEFAEELREMRANARELERKQEEVSRQIGALESPKQKTLSDAAEQKAVLDQLAAQRQRLTNLVEKAGRISELAEGSEPLLSEKLYDTLRKFNQDEGKTAKEFREDLLRRGMLTRGLNQKLEQGAGEPGGKSLEIASEMVRQGFLPEAGEAGQRARAGISQLAQGVERAADSVLGDDTEALRRARDELDAAADDIRKEIAREQASKENGKEPGSRGPAGEPQAPDGSSPETAQASQPGEGNQPGQQPGQQPGEGNQPGAQPGEQPGQGEQPGEGSQGNQPGRGRPRGQQNQADGTRPPSSEQQQQQASQPQDQEGNQPGNQPGQGQSPGNQPGRGRGRGGGQPQPGNPPPQQQAGNEPQEGDPQSNPPAPAPGQGQQGGQNRREATARNGGQRGQPQDAEGQESRRGAFNLDDFAGGSARSGGGPLTGGDYATWSDRLREVEEILDQPELRNDVAQARGRARELRQDFRRNLKKPDWAVVQLQIVKPLVEVRSRINDELARRQSREALVPIDRDPVPDRFSELVRRYYEELGRDK